MNKGDYRIIKLKSTGNYTAQYATYYASEYGMSDIVWRSIRIPKKKHLSIFGIKFTYNGTCVPIFKTKQAAQLLIDDNLEKLATYCVVK